VPRKVAAGLLLGLGAAAVVLILGWAGLLETPELKTYDWRTVALSRIRVARGTPLVHPDIVLVEITDASIRDLAGLVGRWPWPRALQGMLIDYISSGQPRAVAVDVSFLEPERKSRYEFLGNEISSDESDQALAESVARAGNVILLADAVDAGLEGAVVEQADWKAPPYRLGTSGEERPVITLPYPALAQAASGFGHNFMALDPDGPARRFVPFVRKGDRHMPSLGVAAALAGGGFKPEEVVFDGDAIRIRDRVVPLVSQPVEDARNPGQRREQQTMLINYRAPAVVNGRTAYPSYEASIVLKSSGQVDEGETPDIPAGAFKDKIVFVGVGTSGLLDVFQTPFGAGSLRGIQLHAFVADSILSNRFIYPADRRVALSALFAGVIAVGLMAALLPFAAAASGSAALALAWLGASLYGFDKGLWLPLVQPLAGAAVALFLGTAYRYLVEDAEKRRVSGLFGRYVSRDVYKQLMANPELPQLGGARREMTVLFSDLRGFTTITEKGEPEALVAQLNQYFTRMVDIVFRHGGTVDKFVGDMVMALFGAPVDDPSHADAAVAAAVDMVRELGELNRQWAAEHGVQLDIGIGVNSGEMIAGNIGSAKIMSYTVIGDHVNLGARLESLNKDYHSRIIISDATRSRLRRTYEMRSLGGVVVKGKTRPVDIFEVLVPSPLVTEGADPSAVEERTI
jgi:adenylate cyclase